jgi:NAD(P)-dependent dehydrogenase (short-subunit alcohol dehydrogenase family)/acyl carrier protein
LGGLIDLPQELDERAAGLLVDALAGAGEEDQLAVRPAGVFARRLARSSDGATAADVRFAAPQGTILITGGTGGLGAHVARWLARAGAERLLLVSRSGEQAPGAGDLRSELADIGAQVSIVACDVANRDELASAIGPSIEDASLSAVVHAAGAVVHGPVDSMSVEELELALSAKVQGALNLDALTCDLDLSVFVLFSSIAGTVGSGGQGAYAAANACLDALAVQRRARGLPATSVAWGPWAGAGMAAGADGQAAEIMRRRGLECMAPELAVKALEGALLREETCAVVADIRWGTYAPVYRIARARPLIEDVPDVRALSQPEQSAAEQGVADGLQRRLAETPAGERVELVVKVVATEVARVLGHPSFEAIDVRRTFADLGFDSLLAVELRNRLAAVTGLALPATLVFNHPTSAALADYLLKRLSEDASIGLASPIWVLERLEEAIIASAMEGSERTAVQGRLNALVASLGDRGPHNGEVALAEQIQSATAEEMIDLIDRQMGSS